MGRKTQRNMGEIQIFPFRRIDPSPAYDGFDRVVSGR